LTLRRPKDPQAISPNEANTTFEHLSSEIVTISYWAKISERSQARRETNPMGQWVDWIESRGIEPMCETNPTGQRV
jgi:hypothetical protein